MYLETNMNVERNWLLAIAEKSEEDALRLNFADWLDEHGHTARAYFIRAECEWARTGKGPERARWEELGGGARRCLGGYAKWESEGRAAWSVALPVLHGDGWFFARGIPEGVSYTSKAEGYYARPSSFADLLCDVPLVFSVPTLRTISLNCGILQGKHGYDDGTIVPGVIEGADVWALAERPELRQVRTLHLVSASLSPQLWTTLLSSPHLTRLSVLNLDCCDMGEAMIRALVNSPIASGLEELNLSGPGGYCGGAVEFSQTAWRSLPLLHPSSDSVSSTFPKMGLAARQLML